MYHDIDLPVNIMHDYIVIGKTHCMYDYTIYRVRKYFCRYCLQALTTAEILICHIKDCFKINRKQRIKMPKKCEYVRVKNY